MLRFMDKLFCFLGLHEWHYVHTSLEKFNGDIAIDIYVCNVCGDELKKYG